MSTSASSRRILAPRYTLKTSIQIRIFSKLSLYLIYFPFFPFSLFSPGLLNWKVHFKKFEERVNVKFPGARSGWESVHIVPFFYSHLLALG